MVHASHDPVLGKVFLHASAQPGHARLTSTHARQSTNTLAPGLGRWPADGGRPAGARSTKGMRCTRRRGSATAFATRPADATPLARLLPSLLVVLQPPLPLLKPSPCVYAQPMSSSSLFT